MGLFLNADLHFGEKRFKLMARPFTTQQEHVDHLVAKHNAVVKTTDEVLLVGDVIWRDAPEFLPQIARLNGIKTLYRGDQERGLSDNDLKPYFDKIIPEGEGTIIEISMGEGKEPLKCWVNHYPTEGRSDMFNLVGHIHSAWKYQLNMMNVGVDVHHLSPVNALDIPWHLEVICKYYDRDVWAAYHDVNARYQDTRGAKTRYFNRAEPAAETQVKAEPVLKA